MLIEIAHFLSILSTGLFFICFIFSFFLNSKDIFIINLVSRIYSHSFFIFLSSFFVYVWLAISDNFSVLYIAQHSNINLPVFYKISSIWSAHEGSMFLWIIFLTTWGAVYNLFTSNDQLLKARTLGVISITSVGFLLFLLLTSNPFETILPVPPENGADINPVLQDPLLAIHPPMLYMGYVGFVIAFGQAIAFLFEGKPEIKWEKQVRSWSLASWSFLTLGIALGSWWAYYELGWGGYWFWDPVENVALMPWLAATAFVHSLSASSKSSILRIWTLLLSILVFSLSLFGAFIVRSGIIDSVHSFANDPERGLYLLAFIGLLVMVSLLLFSFRFNLLLSNKKIASLSKESFISLNNIFFGTLIFSTMLGVLYPLIYEFIYNQKISVGAPFYNAIFVPITLIACIFLYFSIDSKWQQSLNIKSLFQPLLISLTFSATIVILAFFQFSITNLWTLASLLIGSIIIIRYMIVIYFYFVYRKFTNIFSVIAHCGLGLLIISIALNDNLSSERALNIKINETEIYKDHQITLKNLRMVPGPNFDSVKADFLIENPNGKTFTLTPEKRKYFARGQVTTETAIHASFLKDIYLTIGDQLDDGSWIVNIQFNIFIRWIWFSAMMMVVAGLLLAHSLSRSRP
ncbi:heme lyase CcmF/NrfE family subunit [Gammaproteobacteria bacterium]|nr:heme lyase CcmF/NrfE family subunit [Gammaproteobacteria bacterium]MDA9902881.1 heme lyase CcmF/NrfE family subunit [Gammaproteobacteria bacterium]MDB4848774.1 heme lyase CcmF/NrfE family subunit [Gammaproteobacteria bacterium]MDC0401702.1 heme lyase CcmF/NrfE family subunit [Gammaproteobacteria bacterium]MDC6460162.1 heme lyase CcmF/NrfE family subunit [Gammaproteobacteria bacterium]